MSTKLKAITLVAILAAILVVANFRTSSAQMGEGGVKMVTYVLESNYRVAYDCTFMDKTGDKSKMELVKRIEFHPEYVVLIDQNGAGRLIPVHAIKSITWEQS